MHSSNYRKLKLSFDAVFYYVTDMDVSIAFYRDILGIPLVAQDSVARFDLDGVLLQLVPLPPGTIVPGSGNARLCLTVANLDDTMERMRNRGIPTSKINEKKDGRLAFFRDPDGNELCLREYVHEAHATETVESAALYG